MLNQLFNLPISQEINAYITLRHLNTIPLLIIKHPTCQAIISLSGGQLLFWQPTAQYPIIWLSNKAKFEPQHAIRGGVPLCWPWFGKERSPAHGFTRNQLWQITYIHSDASLSRITLQLKDNAQTKKIWPHAFTLTLTLHLNHTCKILLDINAQATSTAALHSYFYINNIQQLSIQGLGTDYQEKLTTKNLPVTPGELIINQEVDRIYTQPEPLTTIVDKGHQRRIFLSHLNASDIVTWNPWLDNCKNMPDMDDNAYREMVCVETARITSPIITTPQSPTTLGVTIHSEPL